MDDSQGSCALEALEPYFLHKAEMELNEDAKMVCTTSLPKTSID